MATKGPKHPKLSYLAGLPEDATITNIVKREHCDELYITFKSPEYRSCPYCGSNNCIIKDAGRVQTIRHVAVAQRGTIITFHKRRLFCKDCCSTFYENPSWLLSSKSW